MKIHYKRDTKEIWGFYPDFDENIPEPNVEISVSQYNKAISNNDTHIDVNTLTTYKIVPEPTFGGLSLVVLHLVDEKLEGKAKEYGFDSFISAMTYLAVPSRYQAISRALFDWRDRAYAYLENLKQGVSEGNIDMKSLSVESVIEELPAFIPPKD